MSYLKYIKNAPYVVIAILLLIIFSRGKVVDDVVVIPPKTNTITSTSPEPVIVYDTITVEGKKEYVKVPNPVNEELLSKYNNAIDSIERLKLYKEAVTERTYVEEYNDEFQNIKVKSNVIGTLTRQTVEYTTKKQEISFKRPEDRFRVFVGLNTQLPLDNPTELLSVGASLSVVTKNKLFNIGINSSKTITAGISIKL